MPFNFENLNPLTRQIMKHELEYDQENKKLYISLRLNERGVQLYPRLLQKAIDEGNEATLTNELKSQDCFNTYEIKNGELINRKVPYNAAETLSEGEFNRFYIRALCLRAIKEGCKLEVYRAKEVSDPRSESQKKIGLVINAETLLNDLRNNIGINTAFGLPNGPNSGLSMKIK